MSDDGTYGQSPYDDYWDEEVSIDLADDLAEHTAYSPVWQDNPLGELDQYHSDWDYYSDDYYDDDPILLRETVTPQKRLSKLALAPRPVTQNRGRKRKLDEAREDTLEVPHHSVLSTIRGTVWAQKDIETSVIYKRGQQETVALLTDWKTIFRASTGKLQTFGRGQLRRDESWANDMGLADMGLQSERRHTEAPSQEATDSQNEEEHDDQVLMENQMLSSHSGSEIEGSDMETDDLVELAQGLPPQTAFAGDYDPRLHHKPPLQHGESLLSLGTRMSSITCPKAPQADAQLPSPTASGGVQGFIIPNSQSSDAVDTPRWKSDESLEVDPLERECQESRPDLSPAHGTPSEGGAKRRKLTQRPDPNLQNPDVRPKVD